MKKTNKWFSIVLWMFLTILLSLTALVILSYIVPFSRWISGIQNASNAYYQSYSWIEKSMAFISSRWNITEEKNTTMTNEAIGFSYATNSSWSVIPPEWEWNSDYDKDFNTISQAHPVQLQVWWIFWIDWNSVEFYFQVPADLEQGSSLYWWDMPIINWILSSTSDTLTASWSFFTADDINWSCSSGCSINNRNWFTLNWDSQEFWNFYNSNCNNSWNKCTLRLAVVNELKLTNGTQIPYIEYKIDFDNWAWTVKVPLRYTRINSIWKSYWFQKSLNIRIPQQTISQAFDFTVFQ